jgi:hypothetical protein
MRRRAGYRFILGAAAAAVVLLAGCRVPIAQPTSLSVNDAANPDAKDVTSGFIGTVDCSPAVAGQGGMHATPVGSVSYGTVTLKNRSATDSVTINGAELILLDADGALSSHQQGYFTWASGHPPDLPLTLAPGKGVTFTIQFNAITGGEFQACLNLDTTSGSQQVRLTGEAGWVVTLAVTSTNSYGRIVSPLAVTKAASVTFLSTESSFSVTAMSDDPGGLTELQTWSTGGGASVSSTISLTTTVTIPSTATVATPATVTANFANMYVTATSNLQGAIATFTGAAPGTYKGIALAVGSYPITADVTLPQCVIRGGYAVGFGSRPDAYKTEAGRAAGTLITTAGHVLAFSGSSITSDAVIEGVQVTGADNTSGISPAFAVQNGANPTLRYCTFIGGGGTAANSVGLYIYNSSPTVTDCVMRGGNTASSGGRSVGLWNTFQAAPTVTNCTISAGTASGASGKSFGIMNSSYAASPVISGCHVDGGSGATFAAAFWTGEGGRPQLTGNWLYTQKSASSSYGVYIYSNGRLQTLTANHIYDCPTGFVFDYPHDQKLYTAISDVNDDFTDGAEEEANSDAP